MKRYLKISLLKCPKCGNVLVEPSWFVEVSSHITCSCGKEFSINKQRIKDKKTLELKIEDHKIKNIKISSD